MYVPKHFEVTDPVIIEDFIKANSFATLTSIADGVPVATHIPIELETDALGKKVLWGHMAKANPQWKTFASLPKVLAVFLAPLNQYISSSWYNYKEAPTWNYMSVHVTGTVSLIEGERMKESIRRLMDKHEKISKTPLAFDSLPESVLRQLNGLVAFEIQLEKVEAVFKLSQNRDDENYANIIRELRATGIENARLMAEVLERNRPTEN
jgi:transcriptional regulator